MQALIRGSALQGFEELVAELGGDPGPMLAAAQLRRELLGSTDAYIPFRTMVRVIERAAADLGCPDFSLKLSMQQSIEILGPIALIARHSPTSREAIGSIAQYMGNHSPALRLNLDRIDSERTRYTFDVVAPGLSSHVQVYQLGLGVSLGVFRLLMGTEFRPLRVDFAHAPPKDPRLYERFFGSAVRFNEAHCGMELRNTDLDRRRSRDDPQVRQHVARYLDARGPADDDLIGQTRHIIGRALPTGHAAIRTVSAHLGLHTRTLQRWLAKDGYTYERLVDEVRRDLAARYLTESTMSFGQIARTLGYSQQSCLTRSSLRWFDAPPREVRRGAAMSKA